MRQDYAKSRRVAEAFYKHARAAVDASPYPVVEVNGADQRGDRFGDRLANAFADAFARGYRRVIAVGSDCPEIEDVDWEHVSARLEAGVPVLGPTPGRDGTYLIGLRRDQFEKSPFASLPWTTSRLLGGLRRYLRRQCGRSPALLPARDDVNGQGDLFSLLDSCSSLAPALLIRLRELLDPATYPSRAVWSVENAHLRGRRSRAPPAQMETAPLRMPSQRLPC